MVVFDDIAVDEKLKIFDKGASYESMSESARGTEFGEYRAVIRDGEITHPEGRRPRAAEGAGRSVRRVLRERVTIRPETGAAGRRVVAVLEAATSRCAGTALRSTSYRAGST